MPLLCKMCGQDRKLIKAHLIPRKYFLGIRGTTANIKVLETAKDRTDVFEETSQSGVYDEAILCGPCDQKLGAYDHYAYKLFPPKPDLSKILKPDGMGYERFPLPDVDDYLLKKFLIGTLWRLQVTTDATGNGVSLGKYEAVFLRNLRDDSREGFDSIECLASLMVHPDAPSIMFPTVRSRAGQINCYIMNITPWKLIVKVDRSCFNAKLQQIQLRSGIGNFALVLGRWSKKEIKFVSDLQRLFQEQGR